MVELSTYDQAGSHIITTKPYEKSLNTRGWYYDLMLENYLYNYEDVMISNSCQRMIEMRALHVCCL